MKPTIKRVLPGKLSIKENQLYVDNELIRNGDIIYVRWGESVPMEGRVTYYTHENVWGLSCEEFIGHPYLDMPFNDSFLPDVVVLAIVIK